MTPQMQTLNDPVNGDCFAACVASILDLPMSEVPNFMADPERWIEATNDWLRPRGLFMVVAEPPHVPDGHYVAIVPSKRRGFRHAVVATDGRVVHDPSPRAPRTNRNRHRYASAFLSFIETGVPA